MLFKSTLRYLTNKTHKQKHPIILTPFRTFLEDVEITYTRDRGLDHAVEREKDLKPLINIKNLLKSNPSKSLPLSDIVACKSKLEIPYRPIDLIRKYGCIFEEYYPANLVACPHVRLTKESIDLDGEEMLVYASDFYRKNAADRLLKLLMLCRVNEIPLKLVDMLKWDLGLPNDYVDSLVPEFPDCFQVKKGRGGFNEGMLELVCWSDELAVSVVEKRAKKEGEGGAKKGVGVGKGIVFPEEYAKGVVMDKRWKKWMNDWQKLPYVSPYEDATHLQPNSDESDKWAVGVMHELLSILVPKKTDRENLLSFGEYLGIRARFKRALVYHPEIFYLSNKFGAYTVVLKEGYKRGVLIEKQPMMDMRSKYIHLMHKEVKKPKGESTGGDSKQRAGKKTENKEKQDKDGENDDDAKMKNSGSDVEDESDEEDDEEEEMESNSRRGGRGSSKRGTNYTNANRGTRNTSPSRGPRNINASRGTENINASRGRKDTNASRGREDTNASRGREGTNSSRGRNDTNASRGKENTNASRGRENTNASRGRKDTNAIRGRKDTNASRENVSGRSSRQRRSENV